MIPPYKSNHASTIEVLPDGTLAAAWFSGAKEEASGCAIVFARLLPGARSWSTAATLSKRDKYSNQVRIILGLRSNLPPVRQVPFAGKRRGRTHTAPWMRVAEPGALLRQQHGGAPSVPLTGPGGGRRISIADLASGIGFTYA